MAIDLSQFIPTFLEESYEGLDTMESSLLELQPGDVETINTIFRAAHSIKGGSGTFGFDGVGRFTHQLETLLDQMRNGRCEATPARISLLLKAVDCVRELLKAATDSIEPDQVRITDVERQLSAALDADPVASEGQSDLAESEAEQTRWTIHFQPDLTLLASGNDPLLLFRELASFGPLAIEPRIDAVPDLAMLEPTDLHLGWSLLLEADCTEAEVRAVFDWVEDQCQLELTSLTPLPEAEFTELKLPVSTAPVRAAAGAESPTIRVETAKVDCLIDRVGELVITQAMLARVCEQLAELEHPAVEQLSLSLAQLERNTRDLQEDVMRVRMLPISFVFNRFPRVVHDVSSQLGKKVELRLQGEQTELDRTVLEKISDPLNHLLRNALDHGLELPEERLAVGKPEQGQILLKALHEGGYIVIEIADDGRGLNRERIVHKAIERGLIADADHLLPQEIDELIFLPGFSTAETVSDLSGRGVGMDVVRRNIESLGGQVALHSAPGTGTRFTVRLPLTLAILDGQLVGIGGDTYIVPLVAIVETIRASEAMLTPLGGRRCLLRFRGEYLSLVNVRELFELKDEPVQRSDYLIVVVEHGGQKLGLIVDDLLGQQQAVIKSLEVNFKRIAGIAGATIMGDGRVALIVDVAGLINIALDPEVASAARRRSKLNEVQQ